MQSTTWQQRVRERFPDFELSYETRHHKTVEPSTHDLYLSMPMGRKVYLWATLHPDTGKDTLFLLDKRLEDISVVETNHTIANPVFFGTIVSALQVKGSHFIITDLHWFRGVDVSVALDQHTKWACIVKDILSSFTTVCHIPVMMLGNVSKPAYQVHHVEKRRWKGLGQYIHLSENALQGMCFHRENKDTIPAFDKRSEPKRSEPTRNEPKRSEPTRNEPKRSEPKHNDYRRTFWIMADVSYDLYKLYDSNSVFVDYACVVDKKTSIWLNSLFRNIRENGRLDEMEESDDEEDFERVEENKYTDMEKRLAVRCRFQPRLKKWMPCWEDGVVDNVD